MHSRLFRCHSIWHNAIFSTLCVVRSQSTCQPIHVQLFFSSPPYLPLTRCSCPPYSKNKFLAVQAMNRWRRKRFEPSQPQDHEPNCRSTELGHTLRVIADPDAFRMLLIQGEIQNRTRRKPRCKPRQLSDRCAAGPWSFQDVLLGLPFSLNPDVKERISGRKDVTREGGRWRARRVEDRQRTLFCDESQGGGIVPPRWLRSNFFSGTVSALQALFGLSGEYILHRFLADQGSGRRRPGPNGYRQNQGGPLRA